MTHPQRLAVLLVALAACAPLTRLVSRGCPARRGERPLAIDDSAALRLVGLYRLRRELTAQGWPRSATNGDLRLVANDTLSRFYIPTLRGYRRLGNRILGGTYSERRFIQETAFIEGNVLTVGCPYWMCMDASPDVYVIDWIDRDGFGGTWENHQSGLLKPATNAQGERLPTPSGKFCARRE